MSTNIARSIAPSKSVSPRPSAEDRLVEIVRRTIVECALTSEPQPAIPSPSDVECERTVIGALLCGEVTLSDLQPLSHVHMYLGLHRWIFMQLEHCAGAGLEPSVGLLCAAGEREGISADFMRSELEDLKSREVVFPARAKAPAERIVELAEARQMVERLERLAIALRTKLISPRSAREKLRQVVG